MKNNKFNKILVLILVLFLITAALMTYVSRAKYVDSLPLVQTVKPGAGIMQKSYYVMGELEADRNFEKTVYAPADLKITSVNVESGDAARENQLLITFDPRGLELSVLNLKMTLLDLEKSLEKLTDEDEYTAFQRRTAELKIDEAREALEALEKIQSDGGIISPRSSDVTYCIPKGSLYVSAGQPIVKYVSFPARKSIKFTLPYSDKIPREGDGIFCDLIVVDSEGKTQRLEQQRLEITERQVQNNIAYYTVEVNVGSVYMHDGEQISLSTGYVGETEYKYVLPRSAVDVQSGSSGYIYVLSEREGVMGTEIYTRRVNVRILDRDDERVAIEEDPAAPVVMYFAEVYEGMTVRMW